MVGTYRDGWEPTPKFSNEREALALIVGAFTSGIYCSNCGESIDDGCPANCVIGLGRKALTH